MYLIILTKYFLFRYLDGIEKINGTYESFLHGSDNIPGEVKKMEFYIAEFQGLATASFEVSKIGEYLVKLIDLKGVEASRLSLGYIFIVRAKYLQLMTIYYSQNSDESRVLKEFSLFNRFFNDLKTVSKGVFGENLDEEFFNTMPAPNYYFDKVDSQTNC